MRSLLYVPADNARFLARAHERGADCVILDLEDSVPEHAKTAARAGLSAAVALVRRGRAQVAVRVNALTPLDVQAAVAAGVDLIVLPKCDSPAVIADIDSLLRAANAPSLRVLGIVESPAGVLAAAETARNGRLSGIMTGSEDLALALGARPDPDVLLFPKLMVHYAAKAAGKQSFGLIRSIADYADLNAIAEAARTARRHGFDGATCVHPAAVPVLNRGFLPDADDVVWAKRMLATVGTTAVDGTMVDKPVIARARVILTQSEGNFTPVVSPVTGR